MLLSLFAAIIIILAFTPIGFIQLGFIKATTIHVPVIIGSIVLGPQAGALLGFLFGCASLVSGTFTPVLSSFAFSPFIPVPGSDHGSALALIVCFLPRILVGIVPWFVFSAMKRLTKDKLKTLPLIVAGLAGSLTNTLLVMHLIFFLFGDAYATIKNVAFNAVYPVILGIIATNGVPEAIVAAILTAGICRALFAWRGAQNG